MINIKCGQVLTRYEQSTPIYLDIIRGFSLIVGQPTGAWTVCLDKSPWTGVDIDILCEAPLFGLLGAVLLTRSRSN
jgi:hypothetical protein